MIYWKKFNNKAIVPTKATKEAAGYDLYATCDAVVESGEITKVSTGIGIAIPEGFVALIKPRSGLAYNHGVDTLAGVIDSDYRGEIKVMLTTHDDEYKNDDSVTSDGIYRYYDIHEGDRIAQLVIVPIAMLEEVVLGEDEELPESVRGTNGFGSTGKS